MEFHDSEWARKGATLSDKTARSEYGLTQDEIFAAIDAGKLQYRPAAMHGNPWLRLLIYDRCVVCPERTGGGTPRKLEPVGSSVSGSCRGRA